MKSNRVDRIAVMDYLFEANKSSFQVNSDEK